MGLSVISKIANTLNTTTAAAPGDLAAGLPGEFAALLSGQTLAALSQSDSGTSSLLGSLCPFKISQQEESSTDASPADILADISATSAIDPTSLVALMGNPHLQPAGPAHPSLGKELQPSTDTGDEKSALTGMLSEFAQKNNSRRDQLAASLPANNEIQTTLLQRSADKASTIDTANIAAPSEQTGTPPNFSTNLATALHSQRETTPNHQTTISTPLHAEAWPKQFGEKVVWIARNDQQSAQINLNPPQLGPVQITLNLSGDQATAIFASPHAEVRQAIESSLPQLREMLSATGIALGDTNVGANLAHQNPNNAFQTPNRAQAGPENAILPANDNAPVAGITTPLQQGRGLVDLFA